MTKSCSGLTGSLSDVTWYQVPGVSVVQKPNVSSYWSGGSNRIVLAGNIILNGSIVRHEMLHALLAAAGHPRAYFLEKCGGFVTCNAGCVSDAGPQPLVDASTIRVPASDLAVTATLIPARPLSSVEEGVFGLQISVTNTKPYPVVIGVNPGSIRPAFSYSFVPPTFIVVSGVKQDYDSGEILFGAGETKVGYFDFSVTKSLGSPWIPLGMYRVIGAFGGVGATIENARIGF
jgi:hypothetical protein